MCFEDINMIYTKYIVSLTNYLQFLIVWIFYFRKKLQKYESESIQTF